MCLYTQLLPNPKYKPNIKNGGQVPPLSDPRVMYVPVSCGVCMECMKKKARDWKIRLTEEIKYHRNGVFVTLTFDTKSLKALAHGIDKTGYELDNAIATLAVRRFTQTSIG